MSLSLVQNILETARQGLVLRSAQASVSETGTIQLWIGLKRILSDERRGWKVIVLGVLDLSLTLTPIPNPNPNPYKHTMKVFSLLLKVPKCQSAKQMCKQEKVQLSRYTEDGIFSRNTFSGLNRTLSLFPWVINPLFGPKLSGRTYGIWG